MFSKIFASLTKLAERWQNWALDSGIGMEQIVNMLQQIRKEHFVGLIRESHAVVEVAEIVALRNSYDQYFELVYESEYVTVPTADLVKTHVRKNWGQNFDFFIPANFSETEKEKKIKIYKLKRKASSQLCLDFVKKISGSTIYGVSVLAIAEITNKANLPRINNILAFDEKRKLPKLSSGQVVPYVNLYPDQREYHHSHIWYWMCDVLDHVVVLSD